MRKAKKEAEKVLRKKIMKYEVRSIERFIKQLDEKERKD